jgi:branched-chain amino acid transport system substrate-binding protein
MKNSAYFSILFFLIFWLSGCDQKPAITPSGKTIKVGIIAPLSGSVYAYGKEGLKGVEIWRPLQPYLQNGDRVELVVEDDKNDPELSVELLKKLVEKDEVSAIITFSGSSTVMAMAKVTDDYKTPVLAALATHPDITRDRSFISQLVTDDDFQGVVAALFVRDDLLIDTAAVFMNPDSTYSSHLALEFVRKFRSIGGEVTDMVGIDEETGDLAPIIKNVRENAPELLYIPIRPKDVIRVIKEVRKQGWKPQLMGSDGLISTMLAQHSEDLDLVDGMLAADFFGHGMPLTSMGKKARDSFKGDTTVFLGLGIEAYAVLLDAMDRCSDPADQQCINRQIRSTTDFIGIMGKISIGPDGKAQRPLVINSIKNGQSKFIVKVY